MPALLVAVGLSLVVAFLLLSVTLLVGPPKIFQPLLLLRRWGGLLREV